jgi:predicted nucleic acid-binding protein
MFAPQLIAVDTNVIIDYAVGDDVVLDCFSTISRRIPKSIIFVLPTVIQELTSIAFDDQETREKRQIVGIALHSLVKLWGFQPMNCIPVAHGIAEQTAYKLRKNGIIPYDEVNDSLIVAEAALVGVQLLLTNDTHLRDIDQTLMRNILDSCDLKTPVIYSPHRIVKDFFKSAH